MGPFKKITQKKLTKGPSPAADRGGRGRGRGGKSGMFGRLRKGALKRLGTTLRNTSPIKKFNFRNAARKIRNTKRLGGPLANYNENAAQIEPQLTSPATPASPFGKRLYPKQKFKNLYGKRGKTHNLHGRSPIAGAKGSPFGLSPMLSPSPTTFTDSSTDIYGYQASPTETPDGCNQWDNEDQYHADYEEKYGEPLYEEYSDEENFDNEIERDIVPLTAAELQNANLNIVRPGDIIDTSTLDLERWDFRWSQDLRKMVEWIFIAFSFGMLVFHYVDFIIYPFYVKKLLEPFDKVLNVNMGLADQEMKYKDFIVPIGVIFLIFNIVRILIMFHMLEMEDDDYQSRPSTASILLLCFLTILMIIISVCSVYTITNEIYTIASNFSGIFETRQSQYLNNSEMKAQLDKLQVTFQCCGSANLTSWEQNNILKNWTSYEMDHLDDYWNSYFQCRNYGKFYENVKVYRVSHEPNVLERTPAVPYSCCNINSKYACNYYNYNNSGGKYWRQAGTEDALYNQNCQNTVGPKLFKLSFIVESHFFWRISLEFLFFIILKFTVKSFASHHQHHQRPSVFNAQWEVVLLTVWAVLFGIGLLKREWLSFKCGHFQLFWGFIYFKAPNEQHIENIGRDAFITQTLTAVTITTPAPPNGGLMVEPNLMEALLILLNSVVIYFHY